MQPTTKILSPAEQTAFIFLQSLPLPAWIIDPSNFAVVFSNHAVLTQFGYTSQSQIFFPDIFESRCRPRIFDGLNNHPQNFRSVVELKKTSGEKVIVELMVSPAEVGSRHYYQACAIDLSEKEKAFGKLEAEFQRYHGYVKESNEGIFCQELKTPIRTQLSYQEFMKQAVSNSYVSECNDAMARMYGYQTAEELRGQLTEQLIDFSDEANREYFRNFVENGYKVVNAESVERDRFGNTKYFLNNAIGIVEDGYLKRVWGTQRDITSQKHHQNQLIMLAQLVEHTSDMLTAADLDFIPTTWNKAAEKIFNLTAEQAIGKDLRDYMSLYYQNATREEVRQAISEKGEWRGEAYFERWDDRKAVTLLISFKALKDENGTLVGYVIAATDISERKEAESRLRESEKRFRTMADSLPAMIWMTDENNLVTYFNTAWLAFTNVNILGTLDAWLELVHHEDRVKTKTDFARALKAKSSITLVYRLRKENGKYAWVHDISTPRFLADGTFVGYIGTVIDIEEEKQRQEELLYQATVLENVSDIIIATDLQFEIKAWNRRAEKYYAVSEEQAKGKLICELVDFSSKIDTRQMLDEIEQKGVWNCELSIRKEDSETIYLQYQVSHVNNEMQERIGYLFTAKDITDRKIADMKLMRSEKFYRTLISDSLDGMLLVDVEGKISFASPSVKHVLGFEWQELLGKNAFSFVHPDDILLAGESFQKEVVENPEVKFITIRLLKKSGEWLWCMVRGHNLLHQPYINSIVIYFHDDTLRKNANSALRESEHRFRTLIRDIKIGVVMQDKEGRTILCNDAFAEILGVTKEDLEGRGIKNIVIDPIHEDGTRFAPEERPTFRVAQTRMPQRDVVMGIFRPRTQDRAWIIINLHPVLDEQGEILHIICSVQDITERKKMEEDQMAKQINLQRQLTQASIDGQENERHEIGKELHDNIGQQLTTIKLFLDMARTTADDTTNEMVNMALKGVSDVINEVRAISRALVPSTLKDLGLVESINELVDSIERTQVLRIEFDALEFDEDHYAENQKVTLFRIVQEQLNNIVKHSGAAKVWIQLSEKNGRFCLTIRDDGKGFDIKTIRKGLGFMNIKNRAELFEGKAEIHSRPGHGCLLQVTMPLHLRQALI